MKIDLLFAGLIVLTAVFVFYVIYVRSRHIIYDAHMSYAYERMAELHRKISDLNVEIAETRELITYEEDVVQSEDPFEERIRRFRDELNTPTYADNNASTEAGVYNLPHHFVTDTPLRYEEEYAE